MFDVKRPRPPLRGIPLAIVASLAMWAVIYLVVALLAGWWPW